MVVASSIAIFIVAGASSLHLDVRAHQFQHNFTYPHLYAATDACGFHQLIDPNAPPSPPLPPADRRGGLSAAVFYARHALTETPRMFDRCRAQTRWNLDDVTRRVLAGGAGAGDAACGRLRPAVDALWRRMYADYFASGREQMRMADRAMRLFEAALPTWLYAQLGAQVERPLRELIAGHVRSTDAFMAEHARPVGRTVGNFEWLCARERCVAGRAELMERTLADVGVMLGRTEEGFVGRQMESHSLAQRVLKGFGV